MPGERLLKRLRKLSRGQSHDIPLSDYTDSVLADLARIYNTQKGSVLIAEDYGLMDFANLQNMLSPDEMEQLIRNIHDTTRYYEPRLSEIQVMACEKKGDFGVLRFQVVGQLSFGKQKVSLKYDLVLTGDGRAVIETRE